MAADAAIATGLSDAPATAARSRGLRSSLGWLWSGALLLLLTLRMVERPSKVRVGLFGLVVGLSLWQSAQLLPVVVTLIGWAVWRRRAVLRHAWIGAVLAVVGALPSIAWNVRNDWGSFMSPIDDTTTYSHRLRVFASPLMPMLLGLRTPFTQERLLPAVVTLLLYAGIAVLFAPSVSRSMRRRCSLLPSMSKRALRFDHIGTNC